MGVYLCRGALPAPWVPKHWASGGRGDYSLLSNIKSLPSPISCSSARPWPEEQRPERSKFDSGLTARGFAPRRVGHPWPTSGLPARKNISGPAGSKPALRRSCHWRYHFPAQLWTAMLLVATPHRNMRRRGERTLVAYRWPVVQSSAPFIQRCCPTHRPRTFHQALLTRRLVLQASLRRAIPHGNTHCITINSGMAQGISDPTRGNVIWRGEAGSGGSRGPPLSKGGPHFPQGN